MIQYLPRLRKDPETGQNTYAIVQAEDELAAIGMVVGAGWSGLRAITSTSGPGISLMTEFTSLAYFAEVPLVVWDIQRMGPSTGLPTRTSQGDINLCYYLGHGDTKHIVLLPGSVTECFEFGWKSFDLAEEFQTPVFVLSDLDFGMNQWMTPPFEYPDVPIDRGKILWEDDLDKWETSKDVPWGRYLDIDEDGIPYRTVMGNQHPRSAYFTRGTGHDDYAKYSEDAEVWEKNMARLVKKFESSRTKVPQPVIDTMDDANIGIISFGSTDPAIFEARDQLKAQGIHTDYLRLRALPITPAVEAFIQDHDSVYVIEMNRDGQLFQIIASEVPPCEGVFEPLVKNNGLSLTAAWVKNAILEKEGK
jgi:2-oxoglutarate ferredoxin oxidoreductase subunit alpha